MHPWRAFTSLKMTAGRQSAATGVVMVDFNATASGQRIILDEHLASLVNVLSKHRLSLQDVEPDILGRARGYL